MSRSSKTNWIPARMMPDGRALFRTAALLIDAPPEDVTPMSTDEDCTTWAARWPERDGRGLIVYSHGQIYAHGLRWTYSYNAPPDDGQADIARVWRRFIQFYLGGDPPMRNWGTVLADQIRDQRGTPK